MADRTAFQLTTIEVAELRRILGRRPDVLVAARGSDAVVGLLRDRMVIRRAHGWELIAWSDVQRGGWDAAASRLHWELVDQTTGGIELPNPGPVPHAFAERVRASIAVTRHVSLADDLGTVLLVGRRQPGSNDPISWQAEGVGRCDLGDPRVQSQVLALVADLRAEFE